MASFLKYAAVAAGLLSAQIAHAVPLTWSLDNLVIPVDGEATGTFVYDADTGIMSDVMVDILRPGGVFTFEMRVVNAAEGGQYFSFRTQATGLLQGDAVFQIVTDAPLTNAGGTVPLILYYLGSCDFDNCSNWTSGSSGVQSGGSISAASAAVPLPASLPLMLAGFGALAFWRRKT